MSQEQHEGGLFDTPVEACVAVVVDPSHERYGETATIRAHDWKEYGTVFIDLPGGVRDELQDGMMADYPELPQVAILRKDDTADLEALRERLPEIRNRLLGLVAINHKRINPLERRMQAKFEYRQLLKGEEPTEPTLF